MKIKYRIYPTLLDSFLRYINSEVEDDSEMLKELIDKINGIKTPPSPAAAKGIAFKEVLDNMTASLPDTDPDFQHGDYSFSCSVLNKVYEYTRGSLAEVYSERVFQSSKGPVLLYGYADNVLRNMVIDVKTTGNYDFPKYERGMQRYVYPFTLVGAGAEVDLFRYVICDFKNVYIEDYTPTPTDLLHLNSVIEHFINWAESPAIFPMIECAKLFGANKK